MLRIQRGCESLPYLYNPQLFSVSHPAFSSSDADVHLDGYLTQPGLRKRKTTFCPVAGAGSLILTGFCTSTTAFAFPLATPGY